MIEELPQLNVSDWLSNLSAADVKNEPFPLQEVLADSCYYPGAGFDGHPIKNFVGNFISFVYVDYGGTQESLLEELEIRGFRGYEIMASRSIAEVELVPHGWQPMPPTEIDGDPHRWRSWIKKPFCLWVIFERKKNLDNNHGPSRFSLLYLCADGVAAYQALYVANETTAKAIVIVDHGWGCNYTNFGNPNLIFARSVLDNPSGVPEILLHKCGRREQVICWPTHDTFIRRINREGHRMCIWMRTRLDNKLIEGESVNMGYIDQLIASCEKAKASSPELVFEMSAVEDLGEIRKAIYIIEQIDGDSSETFDAFVSYKNISERKCPKPNAPSKVMYVGSSTTNLQQRIKQHIGDGHEGTYALQLQHWFEGNYKITIRVYDVENDVLQIIEDDLSHQLRPAFGKKGGNNR